LSWFLHLFLLSMTFSTGSCTQTPHQCKPLSFSKVTDFYLRRPYVPRHCTSARSTGILHKKKSAATYFVCSATRVMLKNFCAMTCKNHAISSLHRDSFVAKVRGLNPDASSGNVPPLQAGSSLKTPAWVFS